MTNIDTGSVPEFLTRQANADSDAARAASAKRIAAAEAKRAAPNRTTRRAAASKRATTKVAPNRTARRAAAKVGRTTKQPTKRAVKQKVKAEARADKVTNSVVPVKHQQRYRAAGHPTHCGDWLAVQLHGAFVYGKGKDKRSLDAKAYTKFLKANKVEFKGKWPALADSAANGALGRYRMSSRPALEKAILRSGVLVRPDGETVKVPKDAYQRLSSKHPNFPPEQLIAKMF